MLSSIVRFAYELLFDCLLHLVSKASETVFYLILFYLIDTNIIQTNRAVLKTTLCEIAPCLNIIIIIIIIINTETVLDETLLAFIRQKVVTSRTNKRNGRSVLASLSGGVCEGNVLHCRITFSHCSPSKNLILKVYA